MRASTSTMIQDDHLEAEMMSSIGFHVGESAKIIFNIKQCLYQMVKLNVSASIPSRKYDTAPSIIAGSKRNLDDLRRVQSILKGYINTLKTDSDQSQSDNENKHSAVISNSTLSNLRNLTIQIDAKSGGGVSTKSSPKNVVNVIEPSESKQKMREESKSKLKNSFNMQDQRKGDEKTRQRQEFDIINLQKQNIELKNEIIKMRSQINKISINQPENENKKQNYNQNQKQEIQIGISNKLVDVGNDMIDGKGVPILDFGSGPKQEDQNKKKQGVKSKKLKNCNSAIFSTSRNLNGIRDRNKQCLELIKIIKKQIGFQFNEA